MNWIQHIRESVGLREPDALTRFAPDGKAWLVRHDVLLEKDGEHQQYFVERPVWDAKDIERARGQAVELIQNTMSKGNWGRNYVVAFPNAAVIVNAPAFWDGNMWPFKAIEIKKEIA
jgi:hypothetical protein